MVPAIGWILSANNIKLVTPAMINETRQMVIVTARTVSILLVLEFWASAAVLTYSRYCALGAAAFN